MRTRSICAAVTLLLAVFAGCGRKPKARVPATPKPGAVEEGMASWYGYPYHGRQAANGEVYDMDKLTAAHRTLPFGTWVRVENRNNGKTVTVRITDRGPFVDGRIIDLSRAAARDIDMLGPGTAPVRLMVTSRPAGAPAEEFYSVQAGAFREKPRAEQVCEEMRKRYGAARIEWREGNPTPYRVLVGGKRPIEQAKELATRLRDDGDSAFVVRVDTDGY